MPGFFRVLKNSLEARLFNARVKLWCRFRRLNHEIVGERFHYFQSQIEHAVDVSRINEMGISGIASKLPDFLKRELFKEAALRVKALSKSDEELLSNLKIVFEESAAMHYFRQLKGKKPV